MRIFRATNTAVLPILEPKLRPVEAVTKNQYLANLGAWLAEAPDTLMIPVALEDDGTLLGFMICYLPPSAHYVFISQVWAQEPQIAGMLLIRAIEWGDYNGRTQIRMETESDPDGYTDRWKFETITITKAVSFEHINSEWLLNLSLKEQNNGNLSSTDRGRTGTGGDGDEPAKDAEHPDQRTEGHLTTAGGAVPGDVPSVSGPLGSGQDGPEPGDTVRGELSGTADASVRAGDGPAGSVPACETKSGS